MLDNNCSKSKVYIIKYIDNSDQIHTCNSASKSEGFDEWKAPDAMNKMKSVFTLPCLVDIVDPSIRGNKSLCTPSEEASAPLKWNR